MQNVIERMTTLGVESTSTVVESASLAQRQSTQFMASWFKVMDANQHVSREIVTQLVRQATEAGTAWQRFTLDAAQTFDPFATVSRLRQLQETVERLDALNQQIDANARRAETAARKAQSAIDALGTVQEQVTDGVKKAEAAATRAKRIGDKLETLDEQVREGAKQAETAARRAQDARRDVQKVTEQVSANVQRVDAAAERVQQLSDNRPDATQQSNAGPRSDQPAASRRPQAGAKATDKAAPTAEQQANSDAPFGDAAGS